MIDSSQFTGPGAVLALIVAHVRADFWSLDDSTLAHQTARKFLDGGTCEHTLCDLCDRKGQSGWERRLCPGGYQSGYQWCYLCFHPLDRHWVYQFDWSAHRDLLVGSLGLDVDGLVSAIRSGRMAA